MTRIAPPDPLGNAEEASFGPFRFDRRTQQLRHGEATIHLPPRAAAVLGELLAHAGRVVLKDELLDAVWNGTPVTDEALMQAVSLVRRALDDDPRDPRYIETVARRGYRFVGALEAEGDVTATSVASRPEAGTAPARWSIRKLPAAGIRVAVLALVSVAAVLGWTAVNRPEPADLPAPAVRFHIQPPPGVVMPSEIMRESLTISRDGRYVAFVGAHGQGRSIYLRDLTDFETREVTLSEGTTLRSPAGLFFSGDAAWIGFHQGRGLWKIPRAGGAPVEVHDLAHAQGGLWLPDGDLVYRWNMRLWRANADGGEPQQLGDGNFLWPAQLPGGHFVVASWTGWGLESADEGRIYAVDLETREHRELPFRGSAARWAASGHLLFARRGELFAVPFDPETAEPLGAAVVVLRDLATSDDHAVPSYAVSDTGTLVYRPSSGPPAYRVAHLTPDGTTTAIVEGARPYSNVRISPGGTQLVLQSGVAAANLWLYDLERSTQQRLLPAGYSVFPTWAPDGRSVFLMSWRENGVRELNRVDVQRAGTVAETLLSYESSYPISHLSAIWTVHPSGSPLLYSPILRGSSEYDLLAIDPSGGEPAPVLQSEADEWFAAFSPDGRWLAYTSDETGREEVYLIDWPALERRRQISADGGIAPRWQPDSTRLFYQQGSRLMVVGLTAGADPRLSSPELWMDVGLEPFRSGYDVAADGSVYVAGAVPREPINELRVVIGWFDELERLAPHPN